MYNASAWCKADDSKFVRRTRWHSTIALSRSFTMLRIDWPFISIYNLMELSSTEINRSVLCCVLAVWKKSCWRLSKLTWNQNNRKFGENCLVSKDNVQVPCWFSGAYFSCRLGQSSPRWVTIFFLYNGRSMRLVDSHFVPSAKKTLITPPKPNMDTQKRDYFIRKHIFQPLIFRGHVSFPRSSFKHTAQDIDWLSITIGIYQWCVDPICAGTFMMLKES